MESNRSSKRRSTFTKSKLLKSFYGTAKPNSNSSFTSLEFMGNQPTKPSSPSVGLIIMNPDQVFPPQKPKVAFVVPPTESYGKLENFYGGLAEDEAVDAKAARYISSVQERFRLERVNSERKDIQDM